MMTGKSESINSHWIKCDLCSATSNIQGRLCLTHRKALLRLKPYRPNCERD